MKKENIKFIIIISGAIIISFLIGLFVPWIKIRNIGYENFVSLHNEMVGEVLANGNYRCCLMKPCSSCASLSPWHGEGAECDCLSDIVNGLAPCGECVGGILAGRGNKYLAEYFPRAIAEEVGMEHLDTLKKIISEKYNVAIEKLK